MKNFRKLLEKISKTSSCVGSGYCCSKGPCTIARKVYKNKWTAPCPSLVFQDGRHWCGEYLKANDEQRELIADELHIGAGCCSSMNSDRIPYITGEGEKKIYENK